MSLSDKDIEQMLKAPTRDSYKLKWKVEVGDWTKEQLEKNDSGGCDELIIIHLVKQSEGYKSIEIWTCGENGKKLNDFYTMEVIKRIINGKNEIK